MVKLNNVRAVVIGAAVCAIGMAQARRCHGRDVGTEHRSAQDDRNLRHVPRHQRSQRISHVPQSGSPDGTLYRSAAARFQGSNTSRSGCASLHVGYGIAVERCIDHRTSQLFFSTIRRSGQGRQCHAHRAGKTDICRRRAGTTNSGVRDLPRRAGPRQRTLSAPRRSARAVLTQATPGDSECVAHGAGHARSNQGVDKASNGSRGCVSRVDLSGARAAS